MILGSGDSLQVKFIGKPACQEDLGIKENPRNQNAPNVNAQFDANLKIRVWPAQTNPNFYDIANVVNSQQEKGGNVQLSLSGTKSPINSNPSPSNAYRPSGEAHASNLLPQNAVLCKELDQGKMVDHSMGSK